MAKWKCEICGNKFDNFHAQGFDNKIYCPLCFFKKENQELKKQLEDKEDFINKLQATKDKLNKWNYEDTMKKKEFIKFLEDNWKKTQNIWYIKILQKYKEIIGGKE